MSFKFSDFLNHLKEKQNYHKYDKYINPDPKTFTVYPYNPDKNIDPQNSFNIYQFDGYTVSKLFYEGTRDKEYFRADSGIFKEFFDEYKNNPDCSYKTYVNDLLDSEYNPETLSVLMLSKRFSNTTNEVLACKILNYFKIPTAYYTKVFLKNSQDVEEQLLTIDFISTGDDLVLFNSPTSADSRYIESILDKYENLYRKFYRTQAPKTALDSKKIENKILLDKEMLAKTFLVRGCLLNDVDMKAYNIGVITNKDKQTFEIAPNFDLEYCLIKPLDHDSDFSERLENLSQNIKYLYKNYPNVLEEFLKETDELLFPTNKQNKELFHNILKDSFIEEGPESNASLNIYRNYEIMVDNINYIKSENNNDMQKEEK